MTEQEIIKHKEAIDKLSARFMAWLWRNAPSGHLYFDRNFPLADYFIQKFQEKGGMTPEISKEIGW